VEIFEEVGPENIFIFGLNADQVVELKQSGYNPGRYVAASAMLQQVMHLLGSDFFSPHEPGLFRPIYDELMHRDDFCLMADFDAYVAAQDKAEKAYLEKTRWTRMSILNVARCGKFSSDRTVGQYARDIWDIGAVDIPLVDNPA
jgi:starch phosphorylase